MPSMRCDGCSFEEANLLTGKCDLPANNNVFILMSLIEIIIRAQCSISDPCRRVKSIANQNAKEFLEDEYDFIVVGGGVAGKSYNYLQLYSSTILVECGKFYHRLIHLTTRIVEYFTGIEY